MPRQTLALATGLCLLFSTITLAQRDSSLSTSLIEEIQTQFEMDTHARAMQNALTSVSIKDLSENREILASHNTTFSHKIETKPNAKQPQSTLSTLTLGTFRNF